MSKGSGDVLPDMFLVLLVLSALVWLAFIFLIIEFLQRMITGPATEDGSHPTSIFGAPAEGWWIETYDYWLMLLEDKTGADFRSSPEGLFKGSMLLAGGVGGGPGLVASLISSVVFGASFLFLAFFVVFLPVLLICGLSAWLLSRPAAGWFPPTSNEDGEDRWDGFSLGKRID